MMVEGTSEKLKDAGELALSLIEKASGLTYYFEYIVMSVCYHGTKITFQSLMMATEFD
jgi:hypothetical protein